MSPPDFRDDDIRGYYDRKFIQAFDLNGKEVVVTIEGVSRQKIRGEGGEQHRAVLKLRGTEKSFIPCKTDAEKVITGMYGFNPHKWVGKKIAIFPTTCQAFGKIVDCIRTRPTIPTEPKKGGADDAP